MEEINKDIIERLFVESLDGGLDKGSKDELESILSSSEESRKYWQLLRNVWLSSFESGASEQYDEEDAFSKVMARINTSKKKSRMGLLWKATRVAACLAAVVVISFLGGKRQVQSTFSDIVIEAPEGARTFTTLPDGSRLCLYAGSRIVYSQGFGMLDRNVTLIGEGYFDVARNESIPFIINCDNIKVSVLGTEFTVRDHPGDQEVIVSLFKGKLLLNNKLKENDSRTMISDDRMIMNKSEGVMKIMSKSGNLDNKPFAENGYMVFDEMLLSDIINTLHLNYDIDFTVSDDSILKDRYRGIFVKSEQPVEEVLKALALASNGKLHYSIEGKTIILY